MKKQKSIILLLCVFGILLTFSACAAKNDEKSNQMHYDRNTGSTTSKETAPQETSDRGEMKSEELSGTATFTFGNNEVLSMEKIIRKVIMEVETLEFDQLVQSINSKISNLGGYVESSEVSGRRYYSSQELRHGRIVARIPKDKLDDFVGNVYDTANVVNKWEDVKNVTLDYVDTQSRKKSLEIEQERLWALLEKADNLEGIITLESRLSTIRYELQNYETQLRTMDNQVDFSTVTMTIAEVERMTPTAEEKVSVFSRMKNGFSDTMYDIGEGLKNFAVWFVVNLPYLIIWAVIISVAVVIVRRYYKKHYATNDVPTLNQKYKDLNDEKDSSKKD